MLHRLFNNGCGARRSRANGERGRLLQEYNTGAGFKNGLYRVSFHQQHAFLFLLPESHLLLSAEEHRAEIFFHLRAGRGRHVTIHYAKMQDQIAGIENLNEKRHRELIINFRDFGA